MVLYQKAIDGATGHKAVDNGRQKKVPCPSRSSTQFIDILHQTPRWRLTLDDSP